MLGNHGYLPRAMRDQVNDKEQQDAEDGALRRLPRSTDWTN